MKSISKLKYGHGYVTIPPSHFHFTSLAPSAQTVRTLTRDDMTARIDRPVGAPRIADTHRGGDKVLVVVSDATRITGADLFLPLIVERSLKAGVQEQDLCFIFATGVHRKVTETEKISIIGKEMYERFHHYDHDPDSESATEKIGTTSKGTVVRINSEVLGATKIILTGSVDFHYHAGFSGGRKSLVPGLAHRETASSNHLLCLTEEGKKHPFSDGGILDLNPVHEDMLEGALMVSSPFIVNSVMNADGGIEELFAGEIIQAHRRATDYLKSARLLSVRGKTRILVAGCGGYPKDMNFVQANKCIQNCSRLVEDGGVMILVAECAEGYGNSDFADWLPKGKDTILSEMKKDFRVYAQTALSIISVLERIKIIFVSDFKAEELQNLGIRQTGSLEEAFLDAERMIGAKADGYIIENGPRWLLRS